MSFLRVGVVIFGALAITALSIDAFDTISGSQGTLLGSLIQSENSTACKEGMTLVVGETGSYCIDIYEASVGEDCTIKEPRTTDETSFNVVDADCVPTTVKDAKPWRFVTYYQAEQLCARAGKFLPSPELWYKAALGTPDDTAVCNLVGSLNNTGQNDGCRSGSGAYDMIGNVWEYVAGSVDTGKFKEQSLPAEGYVSLVDDAGLAIETSSTSVVMYGSDYFWQEGKGRTVMARGGFYGARTDGGLYSVQAALQSDFSSAAIGFRCASSL